MKDILNYMFEGNKLSKQMATEIMTEIGTGKYSGIEIAAFLTVFKMREIDPAELSGFREAFLDLSIQTDLSDFDTIDVCGTGGDEKNTFNISTLSAIVLAGAGVKVVKHGNNGVSSPSGSSNMFEKLGYRFSNNQQKLKKELEYANICYMHAPLFHPAMKYVAPVRGALKVKTFFNILGPMVNPSSPGNQLIGVFDEKVLNLYYEVYKSTKTNFFIIHSTDGYDEISLTSRVKVAGNRGYFELQPRDFNMPSYSPDQLVGGSNLDESFVIFKAVLEGRGTEAQNNVVLANAALAMHCIKPEIGLEQCVVECRKSLFEQKALKILTKLIDLNK